MSAPVEFVCRNRKRRFGCKVVAEMDAEVGFAEVCGNAEIAISNRWNHSENDLAEVLAEVCGKGVANPLISLSAEVRRNSNKGRRRAPPRSLRFAAPPVVGQIVPNSYFEIDDADVGILMSETRLPTVIPYGLLFRMLP